MFAYRDQLAAAIADRRHDLGNAAVETQPDHLVRLLGPVPDDPEDRSRWATHAARVEAYREEWGIDPDDIRPRTTSMASSTTNGKPPASANSN